MSFEELATSCESLHMDSGGHKFLFVPVLRSYSSYPGNPCALEHYQLLL